MRQSRDDLGTGSRSAGFLKSVERTLDALELLSRHGRLGISDLARLQGVGTSTAHRIATTLANNGFAVKDNESGKYALGHKVFELSRTALCRTKPLNYIKPRLEKLVNDIKESAVCSLISRNVRHTLVVAEFLFDNHVQVRSRLFETCPIHACACGKAYLASLDDATVEDIFSDYEFTPLTEKTVTSIEALKKQLDKFREQGYVVVEEERAPQVSAIAAKINGCSNFPAALSVVAPMNRLGESRLSVVASSVMATASAIGRDLAAVEIA